VTFLGIPSSAKDTIKAGEVFGNAKDCIFFTSDAKKFTYSAKAKAIDQDTSYKLYGSVKSATVGRTRLRRFHKFERAVVEWCITSSSKDGVKFP